MEAAALIAWLVTAGGGLTMVAIWAARGGMRQVHDEVDPAADAGSGPRTRIEPWKVGSHVLLAVLGLGLYAMYLVVEDERSSGFDVAPWLVLATLLLVAGLGSSMAIPWARDRKARKAGGPRTRQPAEQGIPAVIVGLHGLAAVATIALVALVALDVG